jgi:hypothetical protein
VLWRKFSKSSCRTLALAIAKLGLDSLANCHALRPDWSRVSPFR